MKNLLLSGMALGLAACATAEQKPQNQWEVKVKTEGQQKIWVSNPDGTRQCAKKEPALSPDQAALQLKSAGVLVFQSKRGTDGQMHAQKCGAATGSTVELEISRADLTKALGQGFKTIE